MHSVMFLGIVPILGLFLLGSTNGIYRCGPLRMCTCIPEQRTIVCNGKMLTRVPAEFGSKDYDSYDTVYLRYNFITVISTLRVYKLLDVRNNPVSCGTIFPAWVRQDNCKKDPLPGKTISTWEDATEMYTGNTPQYTSDYSRLPSKDLTSDSTSTTASDYDNTVPYTSSTQPSDYSAATDTERDVSDISESTPTDMPPGKTSSDITSQLSTQNYNGTRYTALEAKNTLPKISITLQYDVTTQNNMTSNVTENIAEKRDMVYMSITVVVVIVVVISGVVLYIAVNMIRRSSAHMDHDTIPETPMNNVTQLSLLSRMVPNRM